MNSSFFQNNYLDIHEGNIKVCRKCKDHFEKRATKLKEIIDSKSTKRLIVAGPGTGKTHTFKKVIDAMGVDKKILIFTLINNLADDLNKEFNEARYENVNVGTFHGYCKNLLYNKLGCSDTYYVDLPMLIEEDAAILGLSYKMNDFHNAFTNIDSNNPSRLFFSTRASYYKAVSHNDAVYTVYTHYLDHQDDIPIYNLVIADEYQDFNTLEAAFINLLSKKNNVLIAGDDDQALYGFRNSSTKHIRKLNLDSEYEKFNLPFTSRCTGVIEKAINKLIELATKNGLLRNRIEKEYVSYWPDKYELDHKYPHIEVANCSAPMTAQLFLKNSIEKITEEENLNGKENDIQFLVIGAESQHRLNTLARYLKSTLDKDKYDILTKKEEDVDLSFPYGRIFKNHKDNLGWRILMHNEAPLNMRDIIRKTHSDGSQIYDNLPKEYIEKYLRIVKAYFQIETPQTASNTEPLSTSQKIMVKLTNCLGSKGLSSLYVFVTEFHNGVIPSDKEGRKFKDVDFYRCIVALTRAKKLCTLVTFREYDSTVRRSVKRESRLLDLLPQSCIHRTSYFIAGGVLGVRS